MAVRTSFTAGEVLAAADLTDTFGAKSNLASPTFTGTPAAPTATAGTNTTQLATTAFVLANRGKVLQVVRDTDGTQRTTTSTSMVDVTGMSVTITPQKNTSAILLVATVLLLPAVNDGIIYQITDNSNNPISGAESFYGSTTAGGTIAFGSVAVGYSTPATIAATTYKVRFRSISGGSVNIRNDINTGQLYAIEVSA